MADIDEPQPGSPAPGDGEKLKNVDEVEETEPAASAVKPPIGKGRRAGVWALLAAATVLTVVATLGVWIKRQVVDTENWVQTSSQLLEDPAIQQATSQFLADQVTQSPALPPLVEQVLPPRFDPLAPIVVGGLGQVVDKAALRALRSDRFQQLWVSANRRAQEQLKAQIRYSGPNQRSVQLDLRPLISGLASSLGVPESIASQLTKGDRGIVTVFESDTVAQLRGAAKLFRTLAWVSLVLAILCFAGAVALARGRRASTVIALGAGLVGAGLLVLVTRNMLGDHIVDTVTANGGAVAAAESTWTIGTSLLQQAARSLVIAGTVFAIAGWVGTQTRWARALRDGIAPWILPQPQLAYGVVALLVLLVLAWGPIPAAHTPIGAVLIAACSLGGVAALISQLRSEQAKQDAVAA